MTALAYAALGMAFAIGCCWWSDRPASERSRG